MNTIPRIDIVNAPTPLEYLPGVSEDLGVHFYIKREILKNEYIFCFLSILFYIGQEKERRYVYGNCIQRKRILFWAKYGS